MPRNGPISLYLAALLLGSFLCSIPAHSADQSPWLEIHSAHFTVITDAGEKKGREVALRFEQMRAVFANVLGKDRLHQPVPLTILAFKNDKSYYQVAPLHGGQPIEVPGFFLSGDDQDFIVLNLFEEEPWRAVAHDFAYMLLSYNYPPAQGWFDEGLAEYFSSIRVDNRQVELGGDPEVQSSVSADLLGHQRETHPPKSLTELLLGAQVWLSLPDLFTVKHDPSARNGPRHTLYYAESWMVMHYLLHEKLLPQTGTYFGLVLNMHAPVEDAIQKAFGMSAAQLEEAIKDYFHSQSGLRTAADAVRQTTVAGHPVTSATSGLTNSFPVPVGPDDSVINAKPLPEADAKALYAGVAIRIPERREFGLHELQTLATTSTAADQKKAIARSNQEKKNDLDANPEQLPSNAIGNALAHRILAWDHIEHGEFDQALAELRDAAALNPGDMWLRYYVCVAKYRMAEARHSDIQGLANMMLDLKAVIDWYPEMAAAYDLLALARTQGGGATAALEAERAAVNLSPRDERYVYHLGQIYIAGKQWPAAEGLVDRLKASKTPQLATQLQEQLAQAGAERKYGIPLNSAQAKLAPQKSPFDVLEEDAARRAAAEQAEQSGGPADRRPTKFLQGRLLAVDCSRAPAAILTIAGDRGTLKLRAVDYKSLLLIGADDFSCDWRNRPVNVNYKAGGATDGDVVSLEVK